MHLPLVWSTLCLGLGIVIGDAFPGVFYAFLALVMLMLGSMLKHRTSSDLLILATWIAIGAVRSNIEIRCAWWNEVEDAALRVNHQLVNRLQQAGLSDDAMQLCSAVVLGNKQQLTRETRSDFSRAGASHLLALSGMHLGILYGFLYFVLLKRLRQNRYRWMGNIVALAIIWLYAFLAGLPASLIRASIMLTCCIIAFRRHEPRLALHRLALCVWIMWMINPSYINQLGFWLSVLAVFFILAFYAPLHDWAIRRIQTSHRWIRNCVEMFALSSVAQIGTMPLSAYVFHTFAVLGALWSVALIPLTSFVMYLTLLTLAFPIGIFAKVLNALVSLVMNLVHWMASVPYCVIDDLRPTIVQTVLLYLLLLCFVLRLHIFLQRTWQNRH